MTIEISQFEDEKVLEIPTHTELFAEVAMDSPGLDGALTYAVPDELTALLRPGQLVWGPLKKSRAQGIVVDVHDHRPKMSGKIQYLTEIVDLQPALLPYQIELAKKMSNYYYTGLYEAAALMLPSGLTRMASSAKPTLVLNSNFLESPVTSELESDALFLLPLLKSRLEKWQKNQKDEDAPENPEFLLLDLESEFTLWRSKTAFVRAVNDLVAKGLVRRSFLLPRPNVRPRLKPFVRLAPWLAENGPELEEALKKKLGRAKNQKKVFDYIQQELEPGYLMAADEVCLATDSDMATLRKLVEKGLIEIEEREVRRDPLANRPQREKAEDAPLLTFKQGLVWRTLFDSMNQPEPKVFLLHGVTGSGKTEIYLRAIAKALRDGKQAIVLVPEIALTAQTIDRFAARFPGKIAVKHSRLSPGEAYDEWRRVRDGQAQIVIGARSAIFSPLPDPGLIIIDEEHEWSYKQDDKNNGPFYHTRFVATELARLTGAKVILGSATPSVESFYKATNGNYTLLELPERVAPRHVQAVVSANEEVRAAGTMALPPVQIVDLRQELKSGNSNIFSRDLQHLLATTLEAKRQAILFLNRRGTATVVMCRDCGYVAQCESCETPLVWHADLEKLICHRCGRRFPPLHRCPVIGCGSNRIRHLGIGTKRVEDEVAKLFPQARILRWDQDTVSEGGRDTYQLLFDKMANHEADILVGTQMIAKGLDLPLVSVVGVVTADTGLYLPDFRACERTFQILTQVAGRAGRRVDFADEARVIMQSYTPEQYAIQAAAQHSYANFYAQEITFRSQHAYPPYSKLIKFLYQHKDEQKVRVEADRLVYQLKTALSEAETSEQWWDLIGPAPAFQRKLRDLYRYQFIVRLRIPEGDERLEEIENKIRQVLSSFRMQRLKGWSIDVDPQSVL